MKAEKLQKLDIIEPIDFKKPSQLKIVISEAKINVNDNLQQYYSVDPFVELIYKDDRYKTYVAKVGALNPRFNCSKIYTITDYDTSIVLNLYMSSVS